MDDITRLGQDGATIGFRPLAEPEDVEVVVDLPGLNVRERVSLDERGQLSTFLASLAVDWRGWDGVRTLATFERDFELRCHHDRVGHIVVEVLLGRVPPHEWHQVGWRVHAAVVMEPGALDDVVNSLRRSLPEFGN